MAINEISAEYRVLLQSISVDSASFEDYPFRQFEKLNWERLYQSALSHGVLPQLYHLFKGEENTPDFAWLQRMARAHARRNLRLLSQLLRLLELLEANAIPALSLKGPVLSILAYGDLSLRHYSDLDLLIHPQDFNRLLPLLVRDGFQPDPPLDPAFLPWMLRFEKDYTFCQEERLLEVHWQLAERGVVYPLPDAAAWQGIQSVEILGRSVPTLSLANTFLLLCLHGAKHGWSRLDAVSDLAHLAHVNPGFDWSDFLASTRQLGFEHLVLLGLILANRLAGLPLQDVVLQRITGQPRVSNLATQAVQCLIQPLSSPGELDAMRRYLVTRERFRHRLYYILDQVFIPKSADWHALPLPARLFPIYFLFRPLRISFKFIYKPLINRFFSPLWAA